MKVRGRVKIMEKKLDLILSELQNLNNRIRNLEVGQQNLEAGQKSLEAGQNELRIKTNSIDAELKEFRTETKIVLQIIQTSQQGTREEITQRFKEVKHSLSHLESDISFTFQKTAQNELELNRIKKQ